MIALYFIYQSSLDHFEPMHQTLHVTRMIEILDCTLIISVSIIIY